MSKQHILLTGRPGIGKTTVVERVLALMPDIQADGFITKEFRGPSGQRVGFELLGLDGQRAILAKVGLSSPHRVGRYGVSVKAIETVGVPAIQRAIQHADLIVIDEIGKMELFSNQFRAAVLDALRGPKPVLATIASRPHPFADRLKQMPGVALIEVTKGTRDELPKRIRAMLSKEAGRT